MVLRYSSRDRLAKRDFLARGGLAGRFGLGELCRDPLGHASHLVGRRARLVLRRHLAGVDAIHHLGPVGRDPDVGKVALERVDAEIALLLFFAVTTNAMLGEQRFYVLGKIDRRLSPGPAPAQGQKSAAKQINERIERVDPVPQMS